MAVTAPYIYQASGLTLIDFIRRLFWAGHGTVVGGMPASTLSWYVVEAYDGTTRSAPSGGLLANLPGGHKWRTDAATTLATNSWITVRLQAGVRPTQCVVHAQWLGGAWKWTISPGSNWTIGGGTPTVPALPADALTQSGSVGPGVSGRQHMVLDQSSLRYAAIRESGGTTDNALFYAGEITPYYAADVRPFVIFNDDEPGMPYGASSTYRSQSIHDGATVVTDGRLWVADLDLASGNDPSGGVALVPVPLVDSTASHFCIRGRLRHVSAMREQTLTAGVQVATIGASAQYVGFTSTSTGASGGWVLPWDGSALTNNLTLAYVDPGVAGEDPSGADVVRTVPLLVRSRP